MDRSRVQKGVRSGGQFTAAAHTEPSVTLAPVADTRPVTGASAKREMFGPGTLKDRSPAWTPAAIKKFLGEPDKLVTNPVYRSGPKMRMFHADRVEEIEASDEWKAWEASNRRRSAASVNRKPEPPEPSVLVGQGRNGFYPVVQRGS